MFLVVNKKPICFYRSSSHSSSSDSDSSSDASSIGSDGQGSVKRYNKKKNLGLKSKTPDKYNGWQYRLRIGVDQDQWQDDTSLRIEALKGMFINYLVISFYRVPKVEKAIFSL